MNWKAKVRYLIPPSVLNEVLLAFPWLYRTTLIRYESNLAPHRGLNDLLTQLDLTLHVAGNVVECGSSLCGTSVIVARHLRAKGIRKTVYACDSFEGFDRAELAKEQREGRTRISKRAFTITSHRYVTRKIRRLGVEGLVVPVKGYFQQTLQTIEGGFCFAFVDCDLEESTFYCAETIWPRMPSGGRILFDDYASEMFQGARLGVDRFLGVHEGEVAEHGMLSRLYFVCKK